MLYNIRNLFGRLKIETSKIVEEFVKVIIDPKGWYERYVFRKMLKDCITRANNAFLSLTGYHISKPMSIYQLDDVIYNSGTFEELKKNLEHYSDVYHPLYMFLLAVATSYVFKSTNRPIIKGNVSNFLK